LFNSKLTGRKLEFNTPLVIFPMLGPSSLPIVVAQQKT